MRILIYSGLVLLVLSGCDTTNVQPTPETLPDEYAARLFSRGEYQSAAIEYSRLSESYPENADLYRLRAANAYLEDSDVMDARSVLESISMKDLDRDLTNMGNILLASLAVHQEQPEKALALTENINPDSVSPEFLGQLYETRADSLARLDRFFEAAMELISLDRSLLESEQTPQHTTRIWNYLVNADMMALNTPLEREDDTTTAWLELALIGKSLLNRPDDLEDALDGWSNANPRHPANDEITDDLLITGRRFSSMPEQIALLLPLSGIYERYSERIRDGFLSAWFSENRYKPGIQIYNTDSVNFPEVYQQAVTDGADFIVGPLEKESVRILAEMDRIPVRTLALNQVETERILNQENTIFPIPELVQFGLPPEDEAKQVAQRGIIEGYNRALVITPSDEFGARVYRAFSDEWTSMGGTILERVDYDPQTSDFVTPIKQLLNIDSSEGRISSLRQKLGRNLITSSRLREDIEFVFMVATNLNARQIVPHLRFFRAEGVPIYTISSVYTGKQNPQVDEDLNGVEFVDMPWLLRPDAQDSMLQSQIEQSWQTSSTIYPRYYAFGVDAFRIISQITDLALKKNYRYKGETGSLYMTTDGVIHRNLLWARFDNGLPEPVVPESLP